MTSANTSNFEAHCPSRRDLMLALAAGVGATAIPSDLRAQAKGGSLQSIITPEPPILVLGVNNQGPTLIVASKIYEGLLTYSKALEPQPGLAKSWSVAPNGLSYTFKLQENVKWHDGKPFTSADVVFSVTEFHKELSPRARAIFSTLKAEAPDANTVVFTLLEPFEPFLLMLDVTSTAIVPKHIYGGTDFRTNPANQTPIGTGPFKLQEWRRGSFIHLARFDEYWAKDKPRLTEIYYRVIPDSVARSAAITSGTVQLTQFNDIEMFEVPRLRSLPNLEVKTDGWELFAPLMHFELNHRVKPLQDARVRRALLHSLDRDFIVNRLWFGVGRAATSPICSSTRFHDPSVRLPAYDPVAAARLLDEAGLKPDAQGVRFRLRYMGLPYGEIWNRLGDYVRQSFRKVGVDLDMQAVDVATWVKRVSDWDYDITPSFVYQWGDPTLGVERTYVSTNIQKVFGTNTAGYVNPRVDKLFEQGRKAKDPEERKRIFTEVQKVLIEDVPLLWMFELTFPTIHDKRVRNVSQGGTGIHGNFADVTFG